MTTALFIDTSRRDLYVSTVSVSEVPNRGLVLRFGASVGKLAELTDPRHSFDVAEMPILISKRSFQAKESAGFVKLVTKSYNAASFLTRWVIGIQGMPWQKGSKSLRTCEPFEVILLSPGYSIRQIQTHHQHFWGNGGEHWDSNVDASMAAEAAVELYAQSRYNSVFLIEGQSDYTLAWEILRKGDPPFRFDSKWSPQWYEEHRRFDVFSDESILSSVLYRKARRAVREFQEEGEDRQKANALAFLYANLLFADNNQMCGTTQELLPRLLQYAHDFKSKVSESISSLFEEWNADLFLLEVDEEAKILRALKDGNRVVEFSYVPFMRFSYSTRMESHLLDLVKTHQAAIVIQNEDFVEEIIIDAEIEKMKKREAALHAGMEEEEFEIK